MSANLVRITDPGDPRIAPFRDVRERDLTRGGAFIAEGGVVLDELLRSRSFAPTALLVLENRLAGLADRLERLPPDMPVYVAAGAVIDAIAGFHVHRGILALGGRRHPEPGDLLARIAGRGGLVVAAIGLSNHDNLGSLFRNASAFGAGAVVLDETSCDPFYRKAIRVSVGTVFTVPFIRLSSGRAVVDALAEAGFRCLSLSPAGRTRLSAIGHRGPEALILGAEGPGLPAALLAATESVAIEMAPGLDSLNVSTAAAIVLHHLFAGRSEVQPSRED